MAKRIHLRLPATSANLGPGFDSLGLAMGLWLDIVAIESEGPDRIESSGRNAEMTANARRSLILTTYREILTAQGREAHPLRLRLHNEIPLGMGCGSSAAALLAGVHLANYFGDLHWTPHQVMTEACLREGHPDNVAACALGGMTASSQQGSEILAATCGSDLPWRLLIALPGASLATSKARALLPDTYTRADAVANIQRVALLVSAFAQARPEFLRAAMQDRIHQPYRSHACPLLPLLLPLAGTLEGVHGVALSGAGPSVLVIADPAADPENLTSAIRHAAADPTLEVISTTIASATEVTI